MAIKTIKSLKTISLKNKVYSLDKSALREQNQSAFCFSETSFLEGVNHEIKHLYLVEGRLFSYASDKFVYEITDRGVVKINSMAFEKPPLLVSVKRGGNNEVLLFYNGYACFLSDFEDYSVNVGEHCIFLNGRIFGANKDRVFISKTYPFDDGNEVIVLGEEIIIPKKHGDIVGIVEDENQVVIITKNALFVLKTIGETYEYVLEKVKTFYLDITAKSVKKIGDFVFFASGQELFVYKNNKVEKFTSLDLLKNIEEVYSIYEYYAVKQTNAEELFLISTLDKSVKSLNGFSVLTDGFGYETTTKKLYKITKSLEKENAENIKKELSLDFNSAKTKVVTEIELLSLSPTKILFKGDFGEKEYYFKNGNGVIKCNLASKEFLLTVESEGQSIEKISFTYIVTGE